MKIYINGRFLTRRLTGVDRFAREVLSSIDSILPEFSDLEFVLLAPKGVLVDPPNLVRIPIVQLGRFRGQLWEQMDLPALTLGGHLLSFCNTAPVFKRNQSVVIHDATPRVFPQSYSLKFRLWYRFLLPVLGRVARHIFTISEFSKLEISREYSVPIDRISVLPESGEHMLRYESDDAILGRSGLIKGGYLLSVATLAPHKGFNQIVDAIGKLPKTFPYKFAIAGGVDSKVFARNEFDSTVVKLGYVTNGELKALYQNAVAFVFPSRYEGFGLPPVEALALGCPVLSAEISPVVQSCGAVPLYFQIGNIEDLTSQLVSLASESVVQQAKDRIAHFQEHAPTWIDTAKMVLCALRSFDSSGSIAR